MGSAGSRGEGEFRKKLSAERQSARQLVCVCVSLSLCVGCVFMEYAFMPACKSWACFLPSGLWLLTEGERHVDLFGLFLLIFSKKILINS